MKLDIDFVRAQFNQLNDDPDFVFASNAGGSYLNTFFTYCLFVDAS